MYQFFTTSDNTRGTHIRLTGEDVNHIKNVLRLKTGEVIKISDGMGKEYICEIDTLESEFVDAKIIDIEGSCSELPVELVLFQGFPKGDKMELIIQKAVELGAKKIVPIMTKRSVVKLDEKKAQKKVERYQAIAMAAAKQAKRGVIPEIAPVMTFQEALSYGKTLDMNLIPYEEAKGMQHAKEVIKSVREKKSLGIFIGPEGGFEAEEVQQAMDIGAIPISLGHRILRTETAGMTVLSIIMFELEEDEA